jgi:paraquat-inducible protein B
MAQDESIATRYVTYFSESLRGLSVGAPVTFFGVPVGEVTGVGLALDIRNLDARPRVDLLLYPDRMIASLPGAQEKAVEAAVQNAQLRHALMRRMVEDRGLRAQLTTGSLVTGQLYVALSYFPKSPRVKFATTAEPLELPSAPSTIPQLESKLASIMDKIDKVPFDALGEDLRKTLATLDQTLRDADRTVNRIDADVVPGLKAALDDTRSALAAAERMVTSTENTLVGPAAPGQQEFRAALAELARAARSLRVLADYLERHPEALIRGKTLEAAPR